METLIIEGDSEQIAALKAFLKTVGISFKTETETTEYLLSNSTNKKELLASMQEADQGRTTKVSLDEIWK